MSRLPSRSKFEERRNAFLDRFKSINFQQTQCGFDVNGMHFLYKHAIEHPAALRNRVWQWRGLKLLREFGGRYKKKGYVLLEALTKPTSDHACFLIQADELCKQIRPGKKSFSVPADNHKSERPIVQLVKDNRRSDYELEKHFTLLSAR